MNLDDPLSWRPQVSQLVEQIAAHVAAMSDFDPNVPAYELERLVIDHSAAYEDRVRAAAATDTIAMFHATRLLPSEIDSIAANGVFPLSSKLRVDRLATARKEFPELISADDAELLLAHGPLTWDVHQGNGRLGTVWVVGPITAIGEDPGGFVDLFGTWGGESIAWAATESGDVGQRCRDIVDRLSAVSVPAVIEVAVRIDQLPDWKAIWPTLVGAILGLARLGQEFAIACDLPLPTGRVLTPGREGWERRWYDKF